MYDEKKYVENFSVYEPKLYYYTEDIKQEFVEGVKNIRVYEEKIERYTDSDYASNYLILKEKVYQIAESVRRRK